MERMIDINKEVLLQYCDVQQEIKDIRRRIRELDKYLSSPHQVSDTVKGTRKDGTIGSIKVTGYPVPEHYTKERQRERYKKMLEAKEMELLDLACQAEEYIESEPRSEMRTMLRFAVIDGLTNKKVAEAMNATYPKRQIRYNEKNVTKRLQRYFEENP